MPIVRHKLRSRQNNFSEAAVGLLVRQDLRSALVALAVVDKGPGPEMARPAFRHGDRKSEDLDISDCLSARLPRLGAGVHVSPMSAEAFDAFIVFFGFYCVFNGYLHIHVHVPASNFVRADCVCRFGLPDTVTALANYLSPYNLAPAALGKTSLWLWLLILGMNVRIEGGSQRP